MSEKLENALRGLAQSVENFEKSFVLNQNSRKTPSKSIAGQNDLFSLSQDHSDKNQEKNKAMAAVLDRTIHRMEKLVGENV